MIQLANFEEREFYVMLGKVVTSVDVTFTFQMTDEQFTATLTPISSTLRASKFRFTATTYPEGQYIVEFVETGRPPGEIVVLATVAGFVSGNPIFATSQYNTYNDDGTSTTYVPSDDQGLVPSVSQKLRMKTLDEATDVSYVRQIKVVSQKLRMKTLDEATDVSYVRQIKVTNGTLTDDGDGTVTLDTGGVDTLGALTDVNVTGVTNGQVIAYNNGVWENADDAGGAEQLNDLDDVSLATPANREALIYDGDNWVNDNVRKADVGLGNVDNTSDADKPVSTATQTALDAKADTSAVPTTLNDLSDVTITGTPTGNQALIYDGAAGAFKSLPSFTNRFEDEAEINKQSITPFAERVYTVKSDGDGIFIDPDPDTPTAGKVIVRKIYHKAGFLESGAVIGDFTLIHTFADDTAYSATTSTFEGFRDGDTYGTPPFTLIQTWEEVAEAPSFTGLLNESYGSGAAAAYSTRRLNGNVTDCMVIRRASDSTTTTIGFDGSGNIDEAAINTFCSGTTCTVYQWLDQSGNGNTATAAAQANEPTIYTGHGDSGGAS
jgi:hypothetical protein